ICLRGSPAELWVPQIMHLIASVASKCQSDHLAELWGLQRIRLIVLAESRYQKIHPLVSAVWSFPKDHQFVWTELSFRMALPPSPVSMSHQIVLPLLAVGMKLLQFPVLKIYC